MEAARKRRPRRRRPESVPQKIRFETKGRKFSPNQNPPDVSLKPFNQLTMVHTGNGTTENVYDYSSRDLLAELIKQINPASNGAQISPDHIEMRVTMVKAWNITGSKIAFTAYDFIAKDDTTLCSIVDVGAKDSYPVIGYEFPSSFRETVLKSTKDKIYSIFTPRGNTVIIYTNVLWRFIGNPVFTFSTDLLIHISQQVDKVAQSSNSTAIATSSTAAHTSKIAKSTQRLVDLQPGLVSRIVDGVAHIGAYVAPLAADEETTLRLQDLKESMELLLTLNDAPELV